NGDDLRGCPQGGGHRQRDRLPRERRRVAAAAGAGFPQRLPGRAQGSDGRRLPCSACPLAVTPSRPVRGRLLQGRPVAMSRLVMKFGGTSVADLDRIRSAAAHVKREVDAGHEVAVVVSAMAGKTNELVGWVRETSRLYDAREYDAVVGSGENVTAGLMALTLQEMGVPARSWQGWQVPVHTSSAHG